MQCYQQQSREEARRDVLMSAMAVPTKEATKTCLPLDLHEGSVSSANYESGSVCPHFVPVLLCPVLGFSQYTSAVSWQPEQIKDTGKEGGANLHKSLERILCIVLD